MVAGLIALACLIRPPHYEVTLGQPITEVRGFSWPRFHAAELPTTRSFLPGDEKDATAALARLERKYLSAAAIERPTHVTVCFPSGRTWTTLTTCALMDQYKEKLVTIEIAPHLESLDFPQAVGLAEQLTRELGLQDDRRVLTDIRKWKKMSPQVVRTHQTLEDDVLINVEIKHVRAERWLVWFYFTHERLSHPWGK